MTQAPDFSMRDLEVLQPWRWFAAVAFEYAVFVGVFTSLYFVFAWESYLKLPVIFALLVVLGARQHGLGVLEHEGAHRLVLNDPVLNDLTTKLLAALLLTSSLISYRRFHGKHHRSVGTVHDPELEHVQHSVLGKQWALPFSGRQLVGWWLLDCVGGAVPHMIMLIKLTKPQKARDIGEIVIFQLALITTLVILGLWWVPLVWFGALWTTFWASFRVRIWVEHVGAEEEVESTHCLMKPAGWVRFFFLPNNIWAHLAHHCYLKIPLYYLPEAQRRLQEKVPGITIGDLLRKLSQRSARTL